MHNPTISNSGQQRCRIRPFLQLSTYLRQKHMIFLCLWDTHGFETLESTAETLSNLVWAAAKENDPQDVAAVCVFTAEE